VMSEVLTKRKPRNPRMGLRTSATLATVLALLGHTVFGFEQSLAQVVVALLAGHSSALLFEWVDARANGVQPGFAGGGWKKLVDYQLSAHMTSITLSFLIFVNERLWIMAFTVVLAIASKYVLRVRQDGTLRHFMNPSNFAIAVVLIAYPWTGILPWAFTTDLSGVWDAVVPIIIVGLGLRLNLLFTRRLPTIASWLAAFVVLGLGRSWLLGSPISAELVPLTGVAMVLFTFYMITDPQTSPSGTWGQIAYGSGIALAYTVLLAFEVQYTMFYSVTVVAAARGVWLALEGLRRFGRDAAHVSGKAEPFEHDDHPP
jgi:enediyne biosynthesis protein E5